MTESEPAREPGPSAGAEGETLEERRARVMRRLAEIIRGDPPDLSASGPVAAGGFPELPSTADEFDQESAAELFAALGQFFERHKRPPATDEAPDGGRDQPGGASSSQ